MNYTFLAFLLGSSTYLLSPYVLYVWCVFVVKLSSHIFFLLEGPKLRPTLWPNPFDKFVVQWSNPFLKKA